MLALCVRMAKAWDKTSLGAVAPQLPPVAMCLPQSMIKASKANSAFRPSGVGK